MIHVQEAVVVEGKYDKIKLESVIDGLIIETNGFGIYKDKARLHFIQKMARERGIILLTDSDAAGFQIRHYIESAVPKDQIKHIYIPEVFGKERRKAQRSREGKLGVEGMDIAVLKKRFEEAGVQCAASVEPAITKAMLFEDGFSGGPGSREKRKRLLHALDLPEFLSANALLQVLNQSFTPAQYRELVAALSGSQNAADSAP